MYELQPIEGDQCQRLCSLPGPIDRQLGEACYYDLARRLDETAGQLNGVVGASGGAFIISFIELDGSMNVAANLKRFFRPRCVLSRSSDAAL